MKRFLFALALVPALAACTTEAATTYTRAEAFTEAYDACVDGGGSGPQCRCAVNYVLDNYTLAEIGDMSSTETDRVVVEAIVACL